MHLLKKHVVLAYCCKSLHLGWGNSASYVHRWLGFTPYPLMNLQSSRGENTEIEAKGEEEVLSVCLIWKWKYYGSKKMKF